MEIITPQQLLKLANIKTQQLQVDKLFGEASYRVYYRLTTDDKKTYILMQIPSGKWSVSEEISSGAAPQELPFLNVQRYLFQNDLPVPEVLGVDEAQGWILLQDLGNQSLESLWNKSSSEIGFFFYKQALELLVKLQKVGEQEEKIPRRCAPGMTEPRPFGAGMTSDCIAFTRQFDEKLLNWEFLHFVEYGIEDRLQIKIPEAERNALIAWGKKLCDEIIKLPYGLTHRDYQSRNLMLYGYQFYLIDFQDALLGPQAYDLVALLRDSYISLEWPHIEQLLKIYGNERKKQNLADYPYEKLVHDFHLITLQRKLKDAGRFQFIKTVKGNDKFMVHVPNSLQYVKFAFSQLPEYAELQNLIAKYVVEIK